VEIHHEHLISDMAYSTLGDEQDVTGAQAESTSTNGDGFPMRGLHWLVHHLVELIRDVANN
tara:strand:- start:8 stop:190 length:183 start_codon:yes stop_codon:yes gene_type:complete